MLELQLFCVQVTRNREVVNLTVPEHEIRVLQAMHTPGNVKKVAELDPDIESYDVDESAEAELARLDRKYKHNGQTRNPVDIAFPQREFDLERYGFKAGGELEEAPQSMTVVRKPESKKAKKAAAEKK